MKLINSFLLFFLLFSCFYSGQKYISVSYKSPDELVRDVLIGSQNASCLTVSNVQMKSWSDYDATKPFSYGYFEKGTLPFGIEKGIILSTGSAASAPGPNDKILSEGDNAVWSGDSDLEVNIPAARPSRNATVLEFDFTVLRGTGISFQYIFLSEEYHKTGCSYSDAFAFLIKKAGTSDPYENIALVPNTNEPVSSITINGVAGCRQSNVAYFGGENPRESATNYNGQTTVLTAKKSGLIAGQLYHIKLVIADHLNYQYDSAVFLKAGSFVGDKDLGPDLLIDSNTAICEGTSKTIDATTAGATSYQWYKDGVILPGERGAKLTVSGNPANAGTYAVHIDLAGCLLKGSLKVETQPKAIILDNQNYSFCDNNLSGEIPIKFSLLNDSVVQNNNGSFQVKYYLSPTDAQSGSATPLPDGWLLTADTDIYFRVESLAGCLPVTGKLRLLIGNKTSLLKTTFKAEICDNELLGSVDVNLKDYLTEFNADPAVSVLFFNTLADAKNNIDAIPADQLIATAQRSFGVRLTTSPQCPNVAELIIEKKSPKKSEVLTDQTICKNAKTTLNAGPGFDYYKWSTGEQGANVSSVSNLPLGSYWVDLSSNGCVYKQNVEIKPAESPLITQIDIAGSTVTIRAQTANPPLAYSLDGVNFQGSNIFYNVPRGRHTAYLQDAIKCETITREFLIVNLINVLTPNADGKNDVLDYADLAIKNDVSIQVFDRNGAVVFESGAAPYRWDGKLNGRPLPTGTYWYLLRWTEPDTLVPVNYTGWILIKNRL